MPHDVENEVTAIQAVSFGGDELPEALPKSLDSYRIIRRQPTVSMARALSIAPVVAAEWSVESDDAPEERVEFVRELVDLHESIMERALLGGIDFGWQPFEKVFGVRDGRIVLRKVKPLLHDITKILIDEKTGAFAGFKQDDLVVPLDNALLLSFRVEGTQWYGESLLEYIRTTHDKWVAVDKGASRYDKKVAGSHFVVYYPPGTTLVGSLEKDNASIASDLLKAMEASAGIMMPSTVAKFVDQMKEPPPGWRIELLRDSGVSSQSTFIDRMSYLDKMMVRGLGFPERAILEGEFGTKAEADVHGRAAVTNMDLLHRYVTRMINWHVVDQLLALNWGEDSRGTVWLVASPIADATIGWLRDVYLKIIGSTSGFAEEVGVVDRKALKELLGVPSQDDVPIPVPGDAD